MGAEQYHFVGIGGIGMSGLARILLQRKAAVSGSDLAPSAVTEALQRDGAQVYYGHAEAHVSPSHTVIYTSDVKDDNPELRAARQQRCQLLHRSELLAKLMAAAKPLAVAGTHGKTTTTALLTWVLTQAGLDPSYSIGGLLLGSQSNAAYGRGDYFVAEADESDGSFLKYHPFGAILTNIDLDHIGHYGAEASLHTAFRTFATQVASPQQHLFWCGDDTRLRKLQLSGVSYGFGAGCALRASAFRQDGWHHFIDVTYEGRHYEAVEVALPGRHNAANALVVFGLALRLGVSEEKIRQALRSFPGVVRRCERKGDVHGVLVLDDYAHHPTEIRATLGAIRAAIGPRRLIAVYQPHRYSRTQECVGLYGDGFAAADEVWITDLYSARETPIAGVSHQLVLDEVAAATRAPCRYVVQKVLKDALLEMLRPHDVVVTLGAGDITKLSDELADALRKQAPKKLAVGVICGGISTEHKVTLLSARQVIPKLNPDYYTVKQFGVTTKGRWLSDADVVSRLEEDLAAGGKATTNEPPLSAAVLQELAACDVLVPLLHGTYGEDGIAQGFFEVLGKAYVGPDTRAGAISMDKTVSKKICLFHGIRTALFVDFSHAEWQRDPVAILNRIQESFPWPLWAKPAHLGSSVEVHRVEDVAALTQAIEGIFRVDTHAMVEPEVRGRELEIAVLGNDDPIAFPPGEVFTGARVYDYDGKYSSGGTPTASVAELPPGVAEEGMAIARRIYQLAGCSGLARIDFFLDDQNQFWLIEINPLPGFTRNSLYPRMCEANGLQIGPLYDQLIMFALERRRAKDRLEV